MGVGGAKSTTSQDMVKVSLEFHSVLNWWKEKKKKRVNYYDIDIIDNIILYLDKMDLSQYHDFSTIITGTLMNSMLRPILKG